MNKQHYHPLFLYYVNSVIKFQSVYKYPMGRTFLLQEGPLEHFFAPFSPLVPHRVISSFNGSLPFK